MTKFHCKKCNTKFSTQQTISKCPICYPGASNLDTQAVQQAREAVTKFAHEQLKLATSGLGKSNVLLSIVFGILLFAPIYVLLLMSPNNFAREIVTQRGVIPIFLGVVSLSTLISILFKWVVSRREKPARNDSWLGLESGQRIGPNNVDLLLQRIANDTRNTSRTQKLVVTRVLQRYMQCQSLEKTEAYAGSVLDECYSTVTRSYSSINLAIWALPLLGFIGTVLGIGNSVGGFSGAIEGSGDMEVIKQSLSTVTAGLALSFDTTLLALVLSILLTFPKSHVKHAEERVVEGIERYLRERLFPRLEDIGSQVATGNAAMEEPIRMLLLSQQQLLRQLSLLTEAMSKPTIPTAKVVPLETYTTKQTAENPRADYQPRPEDIRPEENSRAVGDNLQADDSQQTSHSPQVRDIPQASVIERIDDNCHEEHSYRGEPNCQVENCQVENNYHTDHRPNNPFSDGPGFLASSDDACGNPQASGTVRFALGVPQ